MVDGMSFLTYGAYVILGLVPLIYIWARFKHSYWKKRGVPSLPTHWLFGNFTSGFLFRQPAAMVLGDLHKQGGDSDVLGIYIMHKPFLLLRNPEVIKQILVKDFNLFSNRNFATNSNKDLTSINLFSINNPTWKHLRVKLSPIFSSGKLKKLFHLMVDSAEAMKIYLQDQFKDNSEIKTIPIKEMSMKYTTDIISTLAFGVKINSFNSSTSEFFKKSIDKEQETLSMGLKTICLFFFPKLMEYFPISLLGQDTNYFRKIFFNSLNERERLNFKRDDVIDFLIKLKGENSEVDDLKFEGDILLAQAAIFFVAGRETTVSTITFTLYELAKHPEIQNRTRQNILSVLKTDGFTYEGVFKMKYLNQVVSEVLRLYPPAPLLDRVALQDYKIPGTNIVIEKDTAVYVILTGLHTDSRYYEDPERFDPERFSDERKENIKPYTYMPFGEGPRECIGMRLGLLQTYIGLITILSDYEVSLNPREKFKIDHMDVFVSPTLDVTLNLKKVETSASN